MRKSIALLVSIIISYSMVTATAFAGAGKVMYKVTITNITPGQPFAPVMAAIHRPGISFFTLGQAPSDELAMLAEAGNGQPIHVACEGRFVAFVPRSDAERAQTTISEEQRQQILEGYEGKGRVKTSIDVLIREGTDEAVKLSAVYAAMKQDP